MDVREFGVITFKSTHHTIKAEKILLDTDGIKIRTIPTPRDISQSCGLSIKFDLKDLDQIRTIIGENSIEIDSMYKIVRSEKNSRAEKI